MRIIKLSENYPYYLAVHREGRLKGQYPLQIKFVPTMKKMWDQGKLGNGVKLNEFRSVTPRELEVELRSQGINPVFDDVDIYLVRGPNVPRERVQMGRFLNESRQIE